MTITQTLIPLLIFLCVDAVVVGSLVAYLVSIARDFARRFPAQPTEPGAVRREFQTLRFGSVNFGWCFHISVDAAHLHLDPALFLRWFSVPPASVPWSAVTNLRHARSRRDSALASARVGEVDLHAPEWALGLADGGTPASQPGAPGARIPSDP